MTTRRGLGWLMVGLVVLSTLASILSPA
jgi:hypothetical protein